VLELSSLDNYSELQSLDFDDAPLYAGSVSKIRSVVVEK
jgi:hypothetical protein